MMSEIIEDCIQQIRTKQLVPPVVVPAPPAAPKVYAPLPPFQGPLHEHVHDQQLLLSSDSESEEGQVHEDEQVPQGPTAAQAPPSVEAPAGAAVDEEAAPARGARYLYQDDNQDFLESTDSAELLTSDELDAVTPVEIKAFFEDYSPGQLDYGFVTLPSSPSRTCNSCYQLYSSTHECEFSKTVHGIAKKMVSHADVRAAIVAACDPSHRFLARAELEAAAGRVETRSPDMAPIFEQRQQEYYWCPGCLLWCRRKDHDRNACFVLFVARFYASHRSIGWFPKIAGPVNELAYKKRYLTQTRTIESKVFTDSTSRIAGKLQTEYMCKKTDDGERRVVLKADERRARAAAKPARRRNRSAPRNRARQAPSSPEVVLAMKRSRRTSPVADLEARIAEAQAHSDNVVVSLDAATDGIQLSATATALAGGMLEYNGTRVYVQQFLQDLVTAAGFTIYDDEDLQELADKVEVLSDKSHKALASRPRAKPVVVQSSPAAPAVVESAAPVVADPVQEDDGESESEDSLSPAMLLPRPPPPPRSASMSPPKSMDYDLNTALVKECISGMEKRLMQAIDGVEERLNKRLAQLEAVQAAPAKRARISGPPVAHSLPLNKAMISPDPPIIDTHKIHFQQLRDMVEQGSSSMQLDTLLSHFDM